MYPKALSSHDKKQLDELFENLTEASDVFAGYPCNLDFDYSEVYRFLQFSINNVGDPFGKSNYKINTHQFEREVLDWFAKLMHAGKGYRGYITHGGSEGNVFGLNIANKIYPSGVIYYSEHTHYSVEKAVEILNATGEKIPALENGEIDYELLKKAFIKNKSQPAIIVANIGTTMTGAVDDIQKIKQLVSEVGIESVYFHCDAAFSGMVLPFVDDPQAFRFSDGIDSLAISGHKFIGSPIPCGIALVREGLVEKVGKYIEYVEVVDSTITGSRNGIAPLFLWYAIKRIGMDGFKQRVRDCLQMTDYLLAKLKELGVPAWCNANSVIVVIPKPSKALSERWQLACYENIAHIIVCPHIDEARLDRLCSELAQEDLSKLSFDLAEARDEATKTERKFGAGKFASVLGICAAAAFAMSQLDFS